jgi:uncharacterized protein (DUF2384 family)
MSKPTGAPPSSNGLFPGEEQDIEKEAANIFAEPRLWLETPHSMLGGKRPSELIGTEREGLVRDLLRAIKYGTPT